MAKDSLIKTDVAADKRSGQISKLKRQVKQLKQRCLEAEDALNAIRSGTVDALVIDSEEGEKIYTIQGAETTYRLMIESINEGAATLIEDGTILYCNRRFSEMLAMPLESIIASSIYQYISPAGKTAFSRLLAHGMKENCREEATFLGKDGRRLPVMVSINNFSANAVQGVCLVATDLAEIKKAEQLIQRDAKLKETMSEVARLLVEASLDENTIARIIAESAVQLIGDACIIRVIKEDTLTLRTAAHYHPDRYVNNALEQLMPEELLTASEGFSRKVIETGKDLLLPTLTSTGLNKTHTIDSSGLIKQVKPYSLMIVPIQTHDEIIGTIELFRLSKGLSYHLDEQQLAHRLADSMAIAMNNARMYSNLQAVLRTEQTMRQQLIHAEKLSALNRMMATVVHEINNPVQTIKNCIYLAEADAQQGSPQAEYLNMASSEIDRITKLVSSLREIYRKPKTLELEPLEISGLLSDVHSLLEPHLAHQKVNWQQEPAGDQFMVNAVSDHLKQVFLNICLNAIEAMPPDGGTLTISAGVYDSGNEVAVVIEDTGCGIDPADLNKIFEPFYTTKEGGSGLGLPICYEIIQQHAGRITVASELGKGSTFTVWLPLVKPAENS